MESYVQILGSSSAIPAWDRYMSSQYLNVNGVHCLIDCGEGTQYQIKKYKVKASRLDYIFISHLHGDHFFGLPGLLSSFNLLGRTRPLYIFAPNALREVLLSINKASGVVTSYPIFFTDTNPNNFETLIENEQISVSSFPLEHRIDCTGFLFKEKKDDAKLLVNKLPSDFPHQYMKALKKGETVKWKEETYAPKDFTIPPPLPKSYAYCSDTAYTESILPHISQVTLLYHEATFISKDLDRAIKTRHSTTTQAATIAQKAAAKKLLIGHYSIRYKDLNALLNEANEVFGNTFLAKEGDIFTI